jgi:hypothetical protein
LGRNATLMSRCFLGRDQFAAGVSVAGTRGNPWRLFTIRLSETQKSHDCGFARFHIASAFELPTTLSEPCISFHRAGLIRRTFIMQRITLRTRTRAYVEVQSVTNHPNRRSGDGGAVQMSDAVRHPMRTWHLLGGATVAGVLVVLSLMAVGVARYPASIQAPEIVFSG